MQPDRDPEPEEPSDAAAEFDFTRMGLLFYGVMAIVAVLWRVGVYGESIFFTGPEAEASGIAWGPGLGLGVLAGVGVVLLSHVMTRATRWGENLARAMAQALGRLSTPDAILLAFASGLAEEMFFRGALQPRVGWVAASLLFGIVHFVPRREFLPWTFFAIAVGFFFGALFDSTGNLLAPIVAHGLVNAINLPMLVKRYEPQS